MTNSDKNNLNKKNQTTVDNNDSLPTDNEIKKLQQEIDEKVEQMPKEIGGREKDKGLEPTRYGDWEFKGRCIDF